LHAARRDGQFRDDLYHRLNVITVTLPPLKDRREDIPELVGHFLKTRGHERAPCHVSPEAGEALVNYDWPGNVRELANVLHRAQILTDSDTITLNDLPEALLAVEVDTSNHEEESLNLLVVERRLIQEALRRTEGRRPAAARLIGVSARTLYRMIDRLGITAVLAMTAPTSIVCAT
jgi:DNA-binding NtrC family response regulator